MSEIKEEERYWIYIFHDDDVEEWEIMNDDDEADFSQYMGDCDPQPFWITDEMLSRIKEYEPKRHKLVR